MKLTDEVKGYWKIFRNECDLMLRKGGLRKAVATEQIPMVDAVLEAFDTIEALQQEVKGWEQRYDELDAGHSRLFKAFCGLKQENAELQAQVAQYREALKVANNYMPDTGQFCACGNCKICGADINYVGYEHCVKCARVIIDEALSDTPAEYHNPADVALLQSQEQLIRQYCKDIVGYLVTLAKAKEALKSVSFRSGLGSDEETIQEALAAIDKIAEVGE